jgi:hypothetical protein
MEQLKRRKYKFKNHMTSKMEQLKRRMCRQRKHMILKVKARRRKNHGELRNKNRWRLFQQQKKRSPKYNPWK